MIQSCVVDGCDKPTRSSGAQWCKMHYHRWYRHGSVDKCVRGAGVTASHGRRYRSLYLPGHPLAGVGGRVYAHRAVLYDRISQGPHPCHWCTLEVDWLPRGHERELQADHLNGVGDDNRSENLVPSCRTCNITRAMQAKSDALRAAGWWSSHDTIALTTAQTRRARITTTQRDNPRGYPG